ncbi:MAG: hypothetical protein WC766_06230 [Patescibacteria group bacterium]|jgi:hypothetical protein
MAELATFAILTATALVLTFFAIKRNTSKPFSILAGVVAGLLLVACGITALSSGIQYQSGNTQTYTYSSTPTNTSYYNASGSFNASSIENVIIIGSVATANTYSSAPTGLNEGIAVLFILLGIGIAFLTLLSLYDKKDEETDDE